MIAGTMRGEATAMGDDDDRDHGSRYDLRPVYPQDLADQQLLQMLAAMRVIRQHQDAGSGCKHEADTDECFEIFTRMPLDPVQ